MKICKEIIIYIISPTNCTDYPIVYYIVLKLVLGIYLQLNEGKTHYETARTDAGG